MNRRSTALFASLASIALGLTAVAGLRAEPTTLPAATQPAAAAAYPLDVCPISGEKLGEMGPAVVQVIEGREVHFCCGNCPAEFKKDVAGSNKKMDDLIVAATKDKYPMTTCPISGEKLGGDMGKPVMYVDHKTNRLIELCCPNCLAAVQKDPTAALAKIDAAFAAAAAK